MKKETKISIAVIAILVIILGVLLVFALMKNNNSNSNTQNQNTNFEMGEPPEKPDGNSQMGEPPEKSDGNSQMGEQPEKPDGNGGNGKGMPGGSNSSSSSVSYTGATTIEKDKKENNANYSSTTGGQNALLAKSGTIAISNATVTKSGDESSENSDFYGTNAAVLAYNDASLNIENSNITTDGSHANGVFAYGTGKIDISNSKIETTKNNSGGVMVTGGGTLTADNCTVTTQGNSSASIRSDRGGGLLTVNGGNYTTNGVGSPAIYSTAEIVVNNATLTSTASEGAVVEGKNSITLNSVVLTDTNTTLNGNSETYKNIFLYQSMSGDADEGTATFTALNSTIITNKGDTIFVTNTNAVVNLSNNNIMNSDGDFLRIQAGKWGKSGANGGTVTLNMEAQEAEGNIVVDNISTLTMNVTSNSQYTGTINAENTAKNIKLKLDKTSRITLTGDTYVTSLEDEDSSYSNINFNGHKLYVNGTAIN